MDSVLLQATIMSLITSVEDVKNRMTRLEQQVIDLHRVSGRVDVLLQQMNRPYIRIDNDVSCPTNVAGDMHGDIVQGDQTKRGT